MAMAERIPPLQLAGRGHTRDIQLLLDTLYPVSDLAISEGEMAMAEWIPPLKLTGGEIPAHPG